MGGEGRRRALLRREAERFSKPLPRARFNLYTLGTRSAALALIAEELSHWASLDEELLGVVTRDLIDNDFSYSVLARDKIGRFRWVDGGVSSPTEWDAVVTLRQRLAKLLKNGNVRELGDQGDETNFPIDLLRLPTDCDPATLHPYFRELIERPAREPGRAVLREIGPWLTPQDPHLVSEFQNKAFDQRLWELYLWAAFREFGLDIELLDAPDFVCTAPGVCFTVEATTVGPSEFGILAEHPNPKTREETVAFLDDYMPMKYGSALFSKLKKKNSAGLHYWERDVSKGHPFVLAIADFHKPSSENELGSMTYTQAALWQYLYGHRIQWKLEDGALTFERMEIASHKYRDKEVPSGFFDQMDAENVSAIIFSNAGTLAKFDRMGVAAGFGAENTRYFRTGYRYNSDPNAIMGTAFSVEVSDKNYEEWWTEEVQVFHNPRAKIPLPETWLLGAIHHRLKDGLMQSLRPEGTVLSSFTSIVVLK